MVASRSIAAVGGASCFAGAIKGLLIGSRREGQSAAAARSRARARCRSRKGTASRPAMSTQHRRQERLHCGFQSAHPSVVARSADSLCHEVEIARTPLPQDAAVLARRDRRREGRFAIPCKMRLHPLCERMLASASGGSGAHVTTAEAAQSSIWLGGWHGRHAGEPPDVGDSPWTTPRRTQESSTVAGLQDLQNAGRPHAPRPPRA